MNHTKYILSNQREESICANKINTVPFRQDKHEILLEELRKKDAELEEMREFTELERECEKEAINEITKVSIRKI